MKGKAWKGKRGRAVAWRLVGKPGALVFALLCLGACRTVPRPTTLASDSAALVVGRCRGLISALRLSDAEDCCRDLLAREPVKAESLLVCSELDRRLHRSGETLDKLARAVGLDASREVWELYLAARRNQLDEVRARAVSLAENGRHREAGSLLESNPEALSDSDWICFLAEQWRRMGDLEKARRVLDSLPVRQGPTFPLRSISDGTWRECQIRGLGRIALDLGAPEEARALSARLEEMGYQPLPLPAQAAVTPLVDVMLARDVLTRGELAALFAEVLIPSSEPAGPSELLFDVARNPFREAILRAVAQGWMRAGSGGVFWPDRVVSRLELGRIAGNLVHLKPVFGPRLPLNLEIPWAFQGQDQQAVSGGTEGRSHSLRGGGMAPIPSAPRWAFGFPELKGLWGHLPFAGAQGPLDLIRPASGQEIVGLLAALPRLVAQWRRVPGGQPLESPGLPIYPGAMPTEAPSEGVK